MAGGFIMRQTTWNGGLTNTAAERAQMIVKSVANLLIDTGTGWSLDATHNASVDDLMVDNTSNPKVFVLFMKSTHGEKLMLGYSIDYSVSIPAPFGFKVSSSSMARIYGLFTSMIPAGSASVFGQTWMGEGFIPVDATLVHTASFSSSTSNMKCIAVDNTNNAIYRAQVVTDGAIIAFRMYTNLNHGSWWFVGPVIGTLAHSSMDTLPTSKMASIAFFKGAIEGSGDITRNSISDGDNQGSNNYWCHECSYSKTDQYTEIDIFRADGEHMQSADGHGIFIEFDYKQTSRIVSNSSITGFNRWSAYYIGISSTDPTTHYIVRGDGMKGYLDTNFLRKVNPGLYDFGQTFDDGNFVYVGNGVAMGWDGSNGPINAA